MDNQNNIIFDEETLKSMKKKVEDNPLVTIEKMDELFDEIVLGKKDENINQTKERKSL